MNDELKKEGSSVENPIEIFLVGMSFNNNIPLTNKKFERQKECRIKQTILPLYGVSYIDTIYKMTLEHPNYNELLLSIGLDSGAIKDNEELFHSEVMRYLDSNNIAFRLDFNKKNLVIDFPEDKIVKVLDSEYKNFVETSKYFFEQFSFENLLMRIRIYDKPKVKQLVNV